MSSEEKKKTLVISEDLHDLVKMVGSLEKKTLEEITEKLLLNAIRQKINKLTEQQKGETKEGVKE